MLRYLTFNCPICNRRMRLSSTERHHIDGCKDDVGSLIQQETHNAQNNHHAGRIGRCQYARTHWIAGYSASPRISASGDPLPPQRSWLQVFPVGLARAPRSSSMSADDGINGTRGGARAVPSSCPSPQRNTAARTSPQSQSAGGRLIERLQAAASPARSSPNELMDARL
jgi:hypothetical protein